MLFSVVMKIKWDSNGNTSVNFWNSNMEFIYGVEGTMHTIRVQERALW